MKKRITYRFNDGTKCFVEVDDKFYARYNKLLREERRLERKYKRNTISFSELKKKCAEVLDNQDMCDLMEELEESI